MPFNRIFVFFMALCLFIFPLSACQAALAAESAAPTAEETAFLDSLTFLGDSTTAHMQQRAKIKKEQVWATAKRYLNLDSRITYAKIIAPDTGAEERIAEVAARLQPARLVITLGIDYGVYYYRDKPEAFRLYYEKLLSSIEAASPETVLILQSIFPVGRSCKVITNEMVDRANTIVREIADARGLYYIDQKETLADGEGYLKPEYCYSDDGLHLTEGTYAAILSHIASLEGEIGGSK